VELRLCIAEAQRRKTHEDPGRQRSKVTVGAGKSKRPATGACDMEERVKSLFLVALKSQQTSCVLPLLPREWRIGAELNPL
jgi:hypothetical protein